MDFGETHRILKSVDVDALAEKVRDAPDDVWDAEEGARVVRAPNRPTRSIFLHLADPAKLPRDRRIRQDDVERRAGWEAFGGLVEPVIDQITPLYPAGGVVVRCQLAKLFAGGEIKPHRDISPLLVNSHRIHVPLITYPEVDFFIEDGVHAFEAGVAFELNNQRVHAVRNRSAQDRTHLIFDYLPADYDAAAIAAPAARAS